MIKYEKNKGDVSLVVMGTVPNIVSDSVLMIKLIYDRLCEKSEWAGGAFRKVLKEAVSDDLPFMTDETMETFVEGLAEKNEQGE